MPQVKAAAIVEILRSGSPQILLAIMATCTVKVAKARHVRTFESFWIGKEPRKNKLNTIGFFSGRFCSSIRRESHRE